MDIVEKILLPVLVLAAVAFIIGFLLAVAGRVFFVKKDERIDEITGLLPGANCGGCGYAGCQSYAEALVKDDAPCDKCKAVEAKNLEEIAKILGKEAAPSAKMRAMVMCSGTKDLANDKYIYKGLGDCLSVARLGNGPKECPHGCIGLGSCVKACPFGAIKVEDGVAVVEYEKCRACGVCVSTCPQNLIKLIPFDADMWVGCSSRLPGKEVRSFCKVGCIGCGICAKNCPVGAITVENNIAEIDYEKCTNCGLCREKCPRKIIWSGKEQTEKGDTIAAAALTVEKAKEPVKENVEEE